MLNFSPPRYHPGRKPTGAKLALKPVHVWGIRIRLQVARKARDLALFHLALDSHPAARGMVLRDASKCAELMSEMGRKQT